MNVESFIHRERFIPPVIRSEPVTTCSQFKFTSSVIFKLMFATCHAVIGSFFPLKIRSRPKTTTPT